MALTKVRRGGTDTGISDSSDATAITIDSSEKVGIGTTSPSSYDDEADNFVIYEAGSSGHAGITIANDGNDARGHILFADGTSGTAAYQGAVSYDHSDNKMFFRTAATERMRIDSSGNVIVGSTTSPTGASNNIVVSGSNWDAVNDTSDTNVTGILISGTGRMFTQIDGNATGVEVLLVNNIHSSGATCSLIQYRTLNSEEGSLTGNSSGLTINNVSDYRKKERITDLTDSIDVIKTLKPRQYYYRKEFGKPTRAYAGFIAHEVQDSLLPHMTNGLKDGVVTKESKANDEHKDMEIGDPVYQTVAYGDNELITRLV